MSTDKQLPATRKKLERARAEGDVAKSRELTAACGLTAGLGQLLLFPPDCSPLLGLFEKTLVEARDFHSNNMLVSLQDALILSLRLVFPTLFVVCFAVLSAEVLQAGVGCSFKPLVPSFSRLNFFSGFRRMIGYRSGSESVPTGLLVELGKESIILLLLGAAITASIRITASVSLFGEWSDVLELMESLQELCRAAVWRVVVLALVIGAADFLVARRARAHRLRMDIEELRQELRESEGNAEARNMRKNIHRELLFHGVLEGVRSAKIVVVGRKDEGKLPS